MTNKISKVFDSLSFKVSMLAMSFLSCVGFAHAAADADLVNTIASTTAVAQDNKSVMIQFYVTLGLISLGIGLSVGAIIVSIKWIKRALFGGRRR